MESKITKYANNVRLKKWTDIVVSCNSNGMSKKKWCEENHINLKSFYYWQNKLRKQMIENDSPAEIVQINLKNESFTEKIDYQENIKISKNGIERMSLSLLSHKLRDIFIIYMLSYQAQSVSLPTQRCFPIAKP